MGPIRIAPYLAQDIQKSYGRQQRVGERIAEVKTKGEPASEVEISSKARETAKAARAEASQNKSAQIEQLAEEFVNRFLFDPEVAGGAPGESGHADEDGHAEEGGSPENGAPDEGRTAFVRLLESYGLTIKKDESGSDEVIVNKETGDEVVRLSSSTQQNAKEELIELTRNILSDIF